MSTNGEIISQDYTSSIDNIKINDWTKIQMTNTLNLLNGESQSSFYKIEGEKVIYNMDTVKDYLTHICKKENGMLKTYKEMTDDIRSENIESGNKGGATSARTTAVQIALEYLGYDVGKIDGNLGGDTVKAIKEYQKKYNLIVDGKPRPEVIDVLLYDINGLGNEVFKLKDINNKILENEKIFNMKKCLKLNNDGTIEFTKEGLLKLSLQIRNFLSEYAEVHPETEPLKNDDTPIINTLLKGVFKQGENLVMELTLKNGGTKKFVFSFDNEGYKLVLENLLLYILNGLQGEENVVITNIKIILGYDNIFLTTEENIREIEHLRSDGITLESSKPLLNKYMETNNIDKIDDVDLGTFLVKGLNQEMLQYLFGDKITEIQSILPINGYTALRLYKLKCMWGETVFKGWVSSMVRAGMLKKESSYEIGNIIQSGISKEDLDKYCKLCIDLKNKSNNIYFPNLYGYTVKEYSNIIKYIEKNGLPYSRLLSPDNLKTCDILVQNDLPYSVVDFLPIDISGGKRNAIKELFQECEGGKELYNFLSKYPHKLQNLGGKEIKQIELTAKPGGYNFCFRGILEMIKSRDDIELPDLKKDGEQKWKKSRENIIKDYEKLLRDYLSLDKDGRGNEILRNQTFDKVFYANAVKHIEDDWNGALQGSDMKNILKNFCRKFEDCSNVVDKDGKINQKNQEELNKKIKDYAKAHPNEKILVYIGTHGAKDGSSTNGWKKEDRLNLANISNNIQIMSPRCYFGGAYTGTKDDSNYIYGIESPVSGFCNLTGSYESSLDSFEEGYAKGLGFHELQIYTRLNYNYSVTPLTEYMDYIDFRTGKKNHKIVGLADAGIGSGRDDIA